MANYVSLALGDDAGAPKEAQNSSAKSELCELSPQADAHTVGLTADVLEGHLMTLYCRLLDACDAGLLVKAQRVPDDMMPILHAAFDPQTPDERRARTLTQAGDAALAAYVLHEYRDRMVRLERQGRDAFEWKALLGVVLAEAETRQTAVGAAR